MANSPKLLDTIALTEDLPAHSLSRGQVGTIVEELAPDVFEVEFLDNTGRPFAMAPVKSAQLMVLRYGIPEAPSRNELFFKKPTLEELALFLAYNCVRNDTSLEDLHAGTWPSSKTGDYSDVKVVSPYGEIPWNDLSRISDDEMCQFNKEVANNLFTALQPYLESGLMPINPFFMPAEWDQPRKNPELLFPDKWPDLS